MQSDKVPRTRHGLSCISEKPSISARPLLTAQKAAELAAVFETLANDTRLKVLNLMVEGTEASPTELAEKIGMKAQAIANQLKRLCDRGIIVRRREGNQVYYRIVDPCVIDLLERGLWLIRDTKIRKRARNGTLAAQIKFVETAPLDRTEPRRAGPETLGSKGPNGRNQGRRIKTKKKEL
jgi:ArsR family transcriptional regulator, lead/cadmium/zinc/bismuth-responsive transcriptional repressor